MCQPPRELAGSSPQGLGAMTSSGISSFYDLPARPSSDAGRPPLAACSAGLNDLSPVGMPLPFTRPCPGHGPQGTGRGTGPGPEGVEGSRGGKADSR